MDWSNLPPLGPLRAFAAYAETGSVSRAGAALNVSHAAISQQIRALEKHLGISLLDRAGRQMALTPEGQALAGAAARGFGEMAGVVAQLTGADRDRPLHVSVTPMFAASWLMPRLAGFKSAHPDVGLLIDPSVQNVRLEPGGMDVAIRYGDGAWPGVEVELLFAAPVVVVGSTELVGPDPDLSADRISRLPWLQELGTNEASNWLTRFAGSLCNPQSMVELPGNLLLDGLRRGDGVGAVTRTFVEPEIGAGTLQVLAEDDRPNGYWLVTRNAAHRPALKAFLRWLRKAAQDRPQ